MQIKRSIVLSEMVRLARTNTSKRKYFDELVFFHDKLLARGFPDQFVKRLMFEQRDWTELNIARTTRNNDVQRVVPFRIPYSGELEGFGLSKMLNQGLCAIFQENKIRALVAFQMPPNLFLQRYKRWQI